MYNTLYYELIVVVKLYVYMKTFSKINHLSCEYVNKKIIKNKIKTH